VTSDSVQITVVVPTRDRPDALAACLAALARQTLADHEVVVVDDGSVDADAVAAVVAGAPHARCVRDRGTGPAAARNLGASVATAPIVCFTDDDCRPTAGWLEAIVAAIDGGAAAVAGPTRNGRPHDVAATASQTITNHLAEASFDPATHTVGFAPTSNVACRADVHRAYPFDASYPLAAGEDREWCTRLAAHGVGLVFVPAAVVEHFQDLSLPSFWRQQVRYGRGARRWHAEQARGERLQPLRFYTGLLRRAFGEGIRTGVLVIVAQVATAVGVAQETWSSKRGRRR